MNSEEFLKKVLENIFFVDALMRSALIRSALMR